jgi:hypothetical protein
MKNKITFLSMLCLVSTALAQEKAKVTEPIVTDRPDFTESSIVVPSRWLQVESGFTYQSFRGSSSFSAPEVLFRYGLSSQSELRLGLPNYNRLRIDGSTTYGFGVTYLGAKFQLGPFKNGDDFALIPAISIPSDTDFSSGSVDPELKVCWSRDLGSKWSLAMMAYGLWTTEADDRLFIFQPTASFGLELSERLGMFIEYAGSFARTTAPDHVAHVGFAYRPTPDRQFDIHGGFSMNGPDRNPFIAAGYSVRF